MFSGSGGGFLFRVWFFLGIWWWMRRREKKGAVDQRRRVLGFFWGERGFSRWDRGIEEGEEEHWCRLWWWWVRRGRRWWSHDGLR